MMRLINLSVRCYLRNFAILASSGHYGGNYPLKIAMIKCLHCL